MVNLVKRVREIKEQFIVDENGKKIAVIIPIEKYKELLEDLHDLAVIAERREEEVIPFDEVKRRLKERGLI